MGAKILKVIWCVVYSILAILAALGLGAFALITFVANFFSEIANLVKIALGKMLPNYNPKTYPPGQDFKDTLDGYGIEFKTLYGSVEECWLSV